MDWQHVLIKMFRYPHKLAAYILHPFRKHIFSVNFSLIAKPNKFEIREVAIFDFCDIHFSSTYSLGRALGMSFYYARKYSILKSCAFLFVTGMRCAYVAWFPMLWHNKTSHTWTVRCQTISGATINIRHVADIVGTKSRIVLIRFQIGVWQLTPISYEAIEFAETWSRSLILQVKVNNNHGTKACILIHGFWIVLWQCKWPTFESILLMPFR